MIRSLGILVAGLLVSASLAACSNGAGPLGTAASSASPPGSSVAPSAAPSTGRESPGPAGSPAACPTSQPPPLATAETRTVTIETAKGAIVIGIVADLSPIATGNFVALASCGFYDGVVFHRVVPGFVVQGGDGQFGRLTAFDPNRVGTGGPGYTIQDEPVTTTYGRGTVAMARSSLPNSVGSQFFIVLDDSASQALADPQTNNFQIIGTVTSGMEAVDAIAAAADAENPSQPVAMDRVTVSQP